MSALECAMKLSKEEVFEQIKTSGLLEYGLEKELLSDRLSHAIEESKEEEKELGVVAALNNADTTGVLLEVLKADPKKVMKEFPLRHMRSEQRKKCSIFRNMRQIWKHL